MSVGAFLLTDVVGVLLSLYRTLWKRIPLTVHDCSRPRACLGSHELGLYLCSSASDASFLKTLCSGQPSWAPGVTLATGILR